MKKFNFNKAIFSWNSGRSADARDRGEGSDFKRSFKSGFCYVSGADPEK